MLKWALFFLIIAILSGLFGFRGVDNKGTYAAKILCVIFIIIFLATVTMRFWTPSTLTT